MIDKMKLYESLAGVAGQGASKAGKEEESGQSFGAALESAMVNINKLQNDADAAIESVELDNSASIHDAMIALEKADISFRTMMQVRNKLVEAYQEVMRMQV